MAVLGAGGLGHLALQFAHALGLSTVALTGRADKRPDLIASGAEEVLVVDTDPGQALAGAGGADIILSTTNSARQVGAALAGLRRNGRLVNAGITDGPIAVDAAWFTLNQWQLRGSTQDERSNLHEALTLLQRGKVKPKLETYPLERVNEARERLEAGNVRYRSRAAASLARVASDRHAVVAKYCTIERCDWRIMRLRAPKSPRKFALPEVHAAKWSTGDVAAVRSVREQADGEQDDERARRLRPDRAEEGDRSRGRVEHASL